MKKVMLVREVVEFDEAGKETVRRTEYVEAEIDIPKIDSGFSYSYGDWRVISPAGVWADQGSKNVKPDTA